MALTVTLYQASSFMEFFADKIYVIGMHGQLLIAPLVKPKWVGYLLLQVKP